MEWWRLFKSIRVVIFAFISIASLAFAVLLSLYLSKEWVHFSTLQRAIVLALIGVNALTSLLLYLMVVVVFRMWKELLRVVFLLAIHVGTAVPFTLYAGFSLSCAIFNSQTTCKIVDIAFLASAWSITGLLLGYTVYLCIMSRVPRPFPLVTPIDLLDTPPESRTTSMVSTNSATHLLVPTSAYSPPSVRSASPASMYSQSSAERPKTVPKRLFVANATPPTNPLSGVPRVEQLQRTSTYGATRSEAREVEPSILQSRFSTSSIESVQSAAPPQPRRLFSLRASRVDHLFRRPTAPAALPVPQRPTRDVPPRVPPRPLLLNPNPFSDPLSRHGTPETALSGLSYASAPSIPNLGRYPQPPPEAFYLSPYAPMNVPHVYPNAQYSRAASPHVYAVGPPQMLPQDYAYLAPYAVHYAGAPSRAHAATPSASSIHSMSPSIHFHADSAAASAAGHPAALTPAHPANGNAVAAEARVPPAVHLRSASDPVFRAHSADPHMRDSIALPNPYMAGAEIRRYGSVPHMRSGGYEYGAPAAVDDPRWRAAVMQAAAAAAGRG